MNRGVLFLGFLLAITIAGGVLTAGLAFDLPYIIQTTNPDASVFNASETQAIQFLVLAIVVVVVVGIVAGGLAMTLWFLNKQVTIAKEMPTLEERREQESQQLESGEKQKLVTS